MSDIDALYVRDGDTIVATPHTQNGWHIGAQAGGAILGLLAHELEAVPAAVPMSLARLTVDILRPVPIGQRLRVEATTQREGRMVQTLDVTIRSEDREFVSCRALRIRDEQLTVDTMPEPSTDDASLRVGLPAPDDLDDMANLSGIAGFLVTGAEMRSTRNSDGPTCAWLRFRVPIVEGEPIHQSSRATMAADCANLIGISGLPDGVTAINPDASASLIRPPVGEWVGLVGDARFDQGHAHGLSAALMVDSDGVIGSATLSQVVQPPR